MQNKYIGIIIAVVLIAGIGGLVYYKKSASLAPTPVYETPATSAGSESTNPEANGSAGGTSGTTLAQVSQHNSRTSCWAAINGNVYDLTSWIPNHPGGEQAILQLCGTDGSAKFNAQHGGNGRVLSVLAGFKISLLAK